MTLTIADVSEFQTVDWPAYGASTPAVIVRAHNSARPDNKWAQNAAGASRYCQKWAAYQYLTKGADPATAAKAFVATLGGYQPHAVILDLEEGDGDQSGRQHAWLDTVHTTWGAVEWTYSGLYFARAHNVTVDWVAAYQNSEPSAAHQLWQSTDRQQFPGISAPCDGSLFHGSISDLWPNGGDNMALDDNDKTFIEKVVNDYVLNIVRQEGISAGIAALGPKIDQLEKQVAALSAGGGQVDLDALAGKIVDQLKKHPLAPS